MKQLVTRYAPSPTGKLHIGGARTALFCFLFSKHEKGIFILRSEDTDTQRNIINGEDDQINGLNWLGIKPDILPSTKDNNGPYRQSERINIYNKYIDELINLKIAYKCFCTKEEIQNSRDKQLNNNIASPQYDGTCLKNPKDNRKEYVIRLKVPKDKKFEWNDKVRGKISIPSSSIGDWIIQKSDGIPTYNFANVIDDHLMNVTDILRGEEHIANTPKQIHLYQAFNWNIPNFFHLTILTNMEGKKISKRDENGIQFIDFFKQNGYLPEAIFNFLSLLGWSPKEEKEIMTKSEIIKEFDYKRFSKSPSKFDIKKLNWMNNKYINKLSDKDLFIFLNPFLNDDTIKKEKRSHIFNLYKKNLKFGSEISDLTSLLMKKQDLDENALNFIKKNIDVIKEFYSKIDTISNWNSKEIKQFILNIGEQLNKKGQDLLRTIRFGVTGIGSGPDISEIIYILGKKDVKERLKEFN